MAKKKMLTLKELRETGFYFRWAHVLTGVKGELVDRISIERLDLTPEFEAYLKEKGYKKAEGREKNYTDQFYWSDK